MDTLALFLMLGPWTTADLDRVLPPDATYTCSFVEAPYPVECTIQLKGKTIQVIYKARPLPVPAE
jgi:hypothetical protein